MDELDETTRPGLISLISGDAFARSYFHAAMWTCTDDDGEALDNNYSMDDLSTGALAKIWRNCCQFKAIAKNLMLNDGEHKYLNVSDIMDDGGYDFLLTSAGEGAGFWDGDWENGDELTEISQKFRPLGLYIGDDGVIYAENEEE